MQIVDAQIHLWGSILPSNLSHRQVTSFTADEAILLMDEGGCRHPSARLGPEFDRPRICGGSQLPGPVRNHGSRAA